MQIRYTLSGLLLALTIALILEGALALLLPFAWLVGINAVALVFYGIDKLNSKSSAPQKDRIPEFTLLFLALVGGSPAAMLAMILFTHKIKKAAFLFSFFAIVVAQGVTLYSFRDLVPLP
jgi:uncharacterized membrane protein YsdA (DUF1294 family)